jgi:transcriptional regulator with XRE-family HTH domain
MEKNFLQLSEFIRAFRIDQGLSQGDFAKKLGYTQGYVADLERGRQPPSRRFWEKFSKVFTGAGADIFDKSIYVQWKKIEEKLMTEDLPERAIERIQGHILSILRLHDEKLYQKDFEKAINVAEPILSYNTVPSEQKKMIDDILEILDSDDDETVDALRANIRAFLKLVRMEKNKNKGGASE